MATEKHKTVLEIGVEDAELRSFGATMRDAFDTEPIDRHRRAQEQVTREINRQRQAAEAAAGVYRDTAGRLRDERGRFVGGAGGDGGGGGGGGRGRGPGARAGGGGGRGREPMGFWGTAAATGVGVMGADLLTRGAGAGAAAMRGHGAIAGMAGAILGVGPALAAAIGAAENLTNLAVSASQAAGGAFGATGLGPGGMGGMGAARFGISQQQLPGQLAALAQQSGLRGPELARLGPEALRLQALTGISGGAMAGALGAAGGTQDAQRAMNLTKEAIGAGLAAGVREGRLPQFIQQIAQHIEQMRTQGIQVDPRGIPNLMRVFGQMQGPGLRGAAGVQAARGAADTVRTAGQRSDFYGALAMQIAMDEGLSPFQAELALEQRPEEFADKIVRRIGSMGGGPEAQARALKQFMPNLSLQQAYTWVQGVRAGKRGMAARTGAGDEGRARGQDFIDQQEAQAEAAFALAAKQAGLTDRQIAAARKGIARDVFEAREAETGLAIQGGRIGAPVAKFGGEQVTRYMKAINSKDPTGEIGKLLVQDMGSIFSGITKAFENAVNAALKKMDLPTPLEAGKELAGLTGEDVLGALSEIAKDIRKIWEWLSGLKLVGNFSIADLLKALARMNPVGAAAATASDLAGAVRPAPPPPALAPGK